MPSVDNLALGQILLRDQFVTIAQLDEAIDARDSGRLAGPLGEVLIQLGHLTREQLEEALARQRTDLDHRVKLHQAHDLVFASLAAQEGFAAPDEAQRALRAQAALAEGGQHRRIWEILLSEEVLSSAQVNELHALQRRSAMVCEKCYAKCDIRRFAPGQKFRCGGCMTVLRVPEETEAVAESDVDHKKESPTKQDLPPRSAVAVEADKDRALDDLRMRLLGTLPPVPLPSVAEVEGLASFDPVAEVQALEPTMETVVALVHAAHRGRTDAAQA